MKTKSNSVMINYIYHRHNIKLNREKKSFETGFKFATMASISTTAFMGS